MKDTITTVSNRRLVVTTKEGKGKHMCPAKSKYIHNITWKKIINCQIIKLLLLLRVMNFF